MNKQLAPYAANILVPADAGKDQKHRLAKFSAWLMATATPWHAPDLAVSTSPHKKQTTRCSARPWSTK